MIHATRLLRFCVDNESCISTLVARFSSFQPISVSREVIIVWLDQFSPRDYESALLTLENLAFYDVVRVRGLCKDLHSLLKQRLKGNSRQLNDCVFHPVGHLTESGTLLANVYSKVNRIESQFCERSQVPERIYTLRKKGRLPVVVLIDDFVGTGSKVLRDWDTGLDDIIPADIPVLLLVLLGCRSGLRRIDESCRVDSECVHITANRQYLDKCRALSPLAKKRIKQYCKKVGNWPLGFGEMGLLVSFYHGTPNNTISVIRGSKRQKPWKGILPPS